jgi:hypothetical protein
MVATCESENTEAIDQSSFWDEVSILTLSCCATADRRLFKNGIHWDAHRIGWAVSGAFALAVSYCLSKIKLRLLSIFRPLWLRS